MGLKRFRQRFFVKARRSLSRRRRGIALISTMFVLFFLLSLALSYAFAIRLEIGLARNYMDDLQAQFCAKAGIYRALGEIKKDLRSGTFAYPRADLPEDVEVLERYQEVYNNVPIGEGFYTVKFKDNFGQVGLGPMDESSLINISVLAQKQKRDVLRRLFETTTDDLTTIEKIIDCLMDYVDKDDNAQVNGAEEIDYEDLDPPALIANGPMKDMNEFLTILEVMKNKFPGEIDDSIWFGEDLNENGVLDENEDDGDKTPPIDDEDGVLDKGIKNYVTVDSDTDQVNPNTASEKVLEIVMPDRYESIIEERQYRHLAGKSSVFRIRSYGKAHGYTHVIEWVVKIGGRGGYPTVKRMYSL